MLIAWQILLYFRESLFSFIGGLIRPYYKSFRQIEYDVDEDEEDQIYAELDDVKGVVFHPPVYMQRYAAVKECLLDERWRGQLEKIVDLGYHDMSFIKHILDVPGAKNILGVDLDSQFIQLSVELLGKYYMKPKLDMDLKINLYQGNAADPDYRLIGTDAITSIEMIEHMLPHDLERLVHTVFGFVKPRVAIFTTPNGEFNTLFKALESNGYRRLDHFFEWTREQFYDWCANIVCRYPGYTVTCKGIGPGPQGTSHLGCCSQMATFVAKSYNKQSDMYKYNLALMCDLPQSLLFSELLSEISSTKHSSNAQNELFCSLQSKPKLTPTMKEILNEPYDLGSKEIIDEIKQFVTDLNLSKNASTIEGNFLWQNFNWGDNAPYWNNFYKHLKEYIYPFDSTSEDSRILDLVAEVISRLVERHFINEGSKDSDTLQISLDCIMGIVGPITNDVNRVRELLDWNGYDLNEKCIIYRRPLINEFSNVSEDDSMDDKESSSCVNKTFYL